LRKSESKGSESQVSSKTREVPEGFRKLHQMELYSVQYYEVLTGRENKGESSEWDIREIITGYGILVAGF